MNAEMIVENNNRRALLFGGCLGVIVFLLRAVTSGPVYFADGMRHMAAIADHTYVIQPPGYWLFNRTAGLFINPEHAIHLMNWMFSALGAMAFYGCARRIVKSPLAELGAVLYACVFFAWFSGGVHSTYASQLLFPPLAFYLTLRYREDSRPLWICLLAASFALGAGLRPSDGAFIAPMLLLFFFKLPRRHQVLFALLAFLFCLSWFIPSQLAQRHYHPDDSGSELRRVAIGAVAFGKINVYTIANALRFFLPLVLALGPALYFLPRARNVWLWLWVLPASIFFLLVFISDAPYLNCVIGGYILLCLVGLSSSQTMRTSVLVIACSILINLAFYAGFRPLSLDSKGYAIVEKDLGNYTLYAIKHQFFVLRLEFKGEPKRIL
jgi:4-amino-4-deoxy-L-arabinose transferase-like glycosyltransferase